MRDGGRKDNVDELRRMGYETRDVRVKPLVKATIWLAVFLVVAQVVGWAVQYAFINRPGESTTGRTVQASRQLPPAPRLQVEPRRELRDLQQAEQARLNSYGVDARTGVPHMPIERAMQIVAREGVNPPPGAPAGALPRQVRAGAAGVAPEQRAPDGGATQ